MNNKFKITRVHRDESDLNFIIRFPKGKTINNIEDVKFLVKENDYSHLSNSLIDKTLSAGQIRLVSPNVALVNMNVSDYDNITIGALYRASLFCKWVGDIDFDENVERLFDFQTEQNFDNNN